MKETDSFDDDNIVEQIGLKETESLNKDNVAEQPELEDIPEVDYLKYIRENAPEEVPFFEELIKDLDKGEYDNYLEKIINRRTDYYLNGNREEAYKLDNLVETFLKDFLEIKPKYKEIPGEGKQKKWGNEPNPLEIPPERRHILWGIWKAINDARVNAVMKVGPNYDKWEEDLNAGNVEGAELIDKKEVKVVAHDLTLSQGKDGVKAYNTIEVYRSFELSVCYGNLVEIEGKPLFDVLQERATDQINDFVKEKNISVDTYKKYANVVEDYNMGILYKVKISAVDDKKDLFEKRPPIVEVVSGIDTAEKTDAFLTNLRETVGEKKSYDREVLDTVELAGELLDRLRATEEGHSQSESYKQLRDELINFTKLGSDHLIRENIGIGHNPGEDDNKPTDKITSVIVSKAFDALSAKVSDYISEHTGIKNLFRSNTGYGADRLEVAREISDLIKNKEKDLKKYDESIASLSTERVIEAEKYKLRLLNRKRSKNAIDNPPIEIDFESIGPADIKPVDLEQKPYNNIGNGEAVNGIFEAYVAAFDNATNVEGKYRAIINLEDCVSERSLLNQNLSVDEQRTLFRKTNQFKNYVKGLEDINEINKLCILIGNENAKAAMTYDDDKKWTSKMFADNDPQRELKTKYIQPATKGYQMLDTRLTYEGEIRSIFADTNNSKQAVVTALNLKENMKMTDFAKAIGFKGDEINAYLRNNDANADVSVKTYFTFKLKMDEMRRRISNDKSLTPEQKEYEKNHLLDRHFGEIRAIQISNDKFIAALAKEATRCYTQNIIKKGVNAKIKEIKGLSEKKAYAKYTDIFTEKNTEVHFDALGEWKGINGEGRVLRSQLDKAGARGLINEVVNNNQQVAAGERTYDNYIRLHTGYDVSHKDLTKTPDILANAIAASILKEGGKAFSVDAIHKTAKSVKQLSEYKMIVGDKAAMLSSLSDPAALQRAQKLILERTYGVSVDNITGYVGKMKKLLDSMHPAGGQSTEYSNFKAAVQSIANLKNEFNLNTPEGKQNASKKVIQLNTVLLAASAKYMDGKEAVRSTTEGQMRFGNALDSLGILVKYAPGTKDQVKKSVDKINKVRKVKKTDKDYVDIRSFDEKRAAKAYSDRQAAQQAGRNANMAPGQ